MTAELALVVVGALWLSPFLILVGWLILDRRAVRSRAAHAAQRDLATDERARIETAMAVEDFEEYGGGWTPRDGQTARGLYLVAPERGRVIDARDRFAARRVGHGPMGGAA